MSGKLGGVGWAQREPTESFTLLLLLLLLIVQPTLLLTIPFQTLPPISWGRSNCGWFFWLKLMGGGRGASRLPSGVFEMGDEVVGMFQMEPSDSSWASFFIGEQPHRELRLLYWDDDKIGDDWVDCQNGSFPSLLHVLPFAVCIEEVELGLFDKFHNDLSPQMELDLLPITLDSPFVNDK